MSRFLITGGCGFIGSHLADALLAAGHMVRVLDDLSAAPAAQCPAGAVLDVADVADAAALDRAMAGVDGVFHLAAIASVARACADWPGTHRVNLGGTVAVLDAARRAGGVPVVYASSAAIYGDAGAALVTENTPPAPRSPYGADKLGSETQAAMARQCFGLPTLGLRFFNVYGPRQDGASPYSGVISIFRDRLLRREPLVLCGDGGQTRDFIYVADVVAALLAGFTRLQTTRDLPVALNVCTGVPTTITALAAALGRACGVAPALQSAPCRPGDIRHSCGDPALMARHLGLRATASLDTGLARLLGRARLAA